MISDGSEEHRFAAFTRNDMCAFIGSHCKSITLPAFSLEYFQRMSLSAPTPKRYSAAVHQQNKFNRIPLCGDLKQHLGGWVKLDSCKHTNAPSKYVVATQNN